MHPPASLPLLLATVTAFFVGATAVGLGLGFGLERALPHRRVWSLPLFQGQIAHELRGNLVFLCVAIATFTLVLASGVTRFGDDGGPRALGTFAALFLGFQAYYYLLHRLLHLPALVRFHWHHHESQVTTPLSGQSMSAVEALGWMVGYAGLPVAVSFVVPISAAGWAAYVAYNVVGNIVGHANCELFPPSRALRIRALFGGTIIYHALHHARWKGHYGFASAWADRLFGTEWSDWLTLHAQVWSGHPMTSLREQSAAEAEALSES